MILKSTSEIREMSEGGVILSRILKELSLLVKPGVKGVQLEEITQKMIREAGAVPSFQGYRGFPAALCVCINEEAVHCAPDERVIRKGDLVSLDLGIIYNNWHSDSALTVLAGGGKSLLLSAGREALARGIQAVKIGGVVSDIGAVVEKYVEKCGFRVIRDLCGHGIGRSLHEEPDILNFSNDMDIPFKEGMVFCIEPIITSGNAKIIERSGGIQTRDGKPVVHFEHTVAIIDGKCKILT